MTKKQKEYGNLRKNVIKCNCIFKKNVVIFIKYIFKVRIHMRRIIGVLKLAKNIAKGGIRHEKKEEKKK